MQHGRKRMFACKGGERKSRHPQCVRIVLRRFAVDLNQFANAVAPRPRLVDALALLAIAPQPGFDHPLAQRFPAKGDPMILEQLLGRQRRAKNSSTTGG
jgi:hypothetical protein